MKILMVMLLVFGFFTLGFVKPIKITDQGSTQYFPAPPQEEKEDITSTVEEEANALEKKLDEFSKQLEKILEILMNKFNEIMPKLKESGERLQEKFQELLNKMDEEKEAK